MDKKFVMKRDENEKQSQLNLMNISVTVKNAKLKMFNYEQS